MVVEEDDDGVAAGGGGGGGGGGRSPVSLPLLGAVEEGVRVEAEWDGGRRADESRRGGRREERG